jgi:hypothetical protein
VRTSVKKKKTSTNSRKVYKKNKKRQSNIWKFFFLFTVLLTLLFIAGYCVGTHCKNDTEAQINSLQPKNTFKNKKEKKFFAVKKSSEAGSVVSVDQKKDALSLPKIYHSSKNISLKKNTLDVHKKSTIEPNDIPIKKSNIIKPLLAVIIDDVHTKKQLAMIADIGYPVTPSIFPPYDLAPHT